MEKKSEKYLKKQDKKRRGLKCTLSKIAQPRAATRFTCAPGPALPEEDWLLFLQYLKWYKLFHINLPNDIQIMKITSY
jgi:hypothetical protein